MENKFENTWNLWYHHEKDNWKISGYKKIYEIYNAETFWNLYNNWDKIGGILSKQFFLMKDNITPIWEDEQNRNGGCWSFKIKPDEVKELWNQISLLLVLNKISKNKDDINGISICLKKNNNCVIKIWNSKRENENIKNLNNMIFNKIKPEVIYIANVPLK